MKKRYILTVFTVVALIVIIAVALNLPSQLSGPTIKVDKILHCEITQLRNGIIISRSYHAMSETNFGKNQTRNLLGGVNTNALLYFANSNDTSVFDATWTAIPGETVADGLARALGSYVAVTTADGLWNVTLTWTATASITTQLYGVYSTAGAGATLCYAEQQGVGNLKTLAAGDLLIMTVQGTVT